MKPDHDTTRRQLSMLPVRVSAAMPEQPYPPPIRFGRVAQNVTTGASTGAVSVGQYALINEYQLPEPNNTTLIPTANVSTTNWTGNASQIDESPWAISSTNNDWVATSTANATARFNFTDLPTSAESNDPVYSVLIAVTARRTGGGSLNLAKIQIVNSSDTAELTDYGSMTLGADWALATFRQQIIGNPSKGTWNSATLKFQTDTGSGGQVQIAAAAIRVKFNQSTSTPSPALSNIFRTAFVRIDATAVGKDVYFQRFPWGYEIIRTEP